jgi:hypothetical protein
MPPPPHAAPRHPNVQLGGFLLVAISIFSITFPADRDGFLGASRVKRPVSFMSDWVR